MIIQLPPPSIDMHDGSAADWLDQLSEHYTGTDARHVRDLAARLRQQHDAVLAAERADLAKRRKELEERLDAVDDDRRSLDEEARDALAELAALGPT